VPQDECGQADGNSGYTAAARPANYFASSVYFKLLGVKDTVTMSGVQHICVYREMAFGQPAPRRTKKNRTRRNAPNTSASRVPVA
jgi:hypothetical protein